MVASSNDSNFQSHMTPLLTRLTDLVGMQVFARRALSASLYSLLFATSLAFFQPQASLLRPSAPSLSATCVRASCTSKAPRMADESGSEGARAGRRSVLSDAARLIVLGGLAAGGGSLPAEADMTLNR